MRNKINKKTPQKITRLKSPFKQKINKGFNHKKRENSKEYRE